MPRGLTGSVVGEGIRVLLVDDEEDWRLSTREELERVGCLVVTTSNAEGALELVTRHSFDVALVDVVLGRDNGLRLLRELKQRVPLLPVVVISAFHSTRA